MIVVVSIKRTYFLKLLIHTSFIIIILDDCCIYVLKLPFFMFGIWKNNPCISILDQVAQLLSCKLHFLYQFEVDSITWHLKVFQFTKSVLLPFPFKLLNLLLAIGKIFSFISLKKLKNICTVYRCKCKLPGNLCFKSVYSTFISS